MLSDRRIRVTVTVDVNDLIECVASGERQQSPTNLLSRKVTGKSDGLKNIRFRVVDGYSWSEWGQDEDRGNVVVQVEGDLL